jgi:glycolate oxidase iron-sulfur subunit
MHTKLAAEIRNTPAGQEAAAIVGSCVHCGFCQATCPTYQLLGDELDSPRGRIYLIKQVLEGIAPTAQTQLHLDRCLTCRACETACPSGVQYGRLLDIGRKLVDEKVPRSLPDRMERGALRNGLTGPLFAPAMKLGQALRPFLPGSLQTKVPVARDAGQWPTRQHARKMILLEGCVQPALAPNINAATARVLDRLEIELVVPPKAGCCGAIRQHLGHQDGALHDARRNIDAWWPEVQAGAEALIMNASGCGAMVREYAHLLRNDSAYAAKALRVSGMMRDVVEIVGAHSTLLEKKVAPASHERVVFHPPCTQQHALGLRGAVEKLLIACGAEVVPFADSHLCCGSAGTYSLLQPELAGQLRERKLEALLTPRPSRILSANIGCIAHLGAEAPVPVEHWIEWLDSRLDGSEAGQP